MKKIVLILTLFITSMIQPVSANDFAGLSQFKGNQGMGLLQLLGQVDLQAGQKKKFLEIMQNTEEKRAEIRKNLKAAMEKINQLGENDESTEKDVREVVQKAQVHMEELFLMKVQIQKEVRKILTPEQYSLIQNFKEEKKSKFAMIRTLIQGAFKAFLGQS